MKYLKCKGAMVIIEAEHLCMSMRGVKKWGSKTTTIVTRGDFQKDSSLKQDVLNILRL